MSSKAYILKTLPHDSMTVKWENLGKEHSDGAPFNCINYSNFTVTFNGIFDGAKVRIKGAIDEDFHTLSTRQGDSITAGSPMICTVNERPLVIMPVVEHSGSKTDIKVDIFCWK